MNLLIENLKRRIINFALKIPVQIDVKEWIENQLLSSPFVLTTINGMSFETVALSGREKQINIAVRYQDVIYPGIVFGVKDIFELITAVSVSLKCHLQRMVVVIDNRSGFVSLDRIAAQINACKEYVGEELEIHQFDSSKSKWRSFFEDRIIIYTLETSYFDTAKDINDLSCILAEHAHKIRAVCGNNSDLIVNSIMKWFRKNIEYKNNNQLSDHSAVGLYKNKTAVCQGIAAYAYQLLSFCGLEARYVSGEGSGSDGWGSHGWNMVKLNGVWRHIDYTFELRSYGSSVIKNEREFKKNHHWDESKYSSKRSDELSNARKTLNASVIILLPGEDRISVNGCLVDCTGLHQVCKVVNNAIYVSLLDIINCYGGCYCLRDTNMCIYLGVNSYKIPFNQLNYNGGAWYINALWLKKLKIRLTIDEGAIVLQNNNL